MNTDSRKNKASSLRCFMTNVHNGNPKIFINRMTTPSHFDHSYTKKNPVLRKQTPPKCYLPNNKASLVLQDLLLCFEVFAFRFRYINVLAFSVQVGVLLHVFITLPCVITLVFRCSKIYRQAMILLTS